MTEFSLEELKFDIDWIKDNIPRYLAPGKKKELIQRWAENLELLHDKGDFAPPVNTICSHIRNELKAMSEDSSMVYVNEVLAFKYKQIQYTIPDFDYEEQASESRSLDSSSEPDYTELNKDYIDVISKTITVFQEAKKALEKKMTIQPHIPKQEWDEFKLRWEYGIKRLDEVLDGREKVPPTTMHIMLYCVAHYTQSNIYSHYVRFRAAEAELTPKQTGKIIKGHVSKMTLLFEPKSPQEALSNGFYGQQCGECGSYRTDNKYNSNNNTFQLFCFACSAWCKLKTERIKIRQ